MYRSRQTNTDKNTPKAVHQKGRSFQREDTKNHPEQFIDQLEVENLVRAASAGSTPTTDKPYPSRWTITGAGVAFTIAVVCIFFLI